MPRTRRLLEVIDSTVDKHGSFEDFFFHVADEARKRSWEMAFAFPAVRTPEVRHMLESAGAAVHTVDGKWASYPGALRLIRLIARLRPDVVNFHFCGTLHYLPVFLYCMLTGRKVIFHYHGEIRPLSTLRWKNRHVSAFRLTSLFWTRVVTVSQANQRYLAALRVHSPIMVIYNGIDTTMFLERAASAATEERAGGGFEICYIGSLIPRKRVDMLLRAFAQVAAARPDARLTIVGGGHLAESHQQLCGQLGLNGNVRFMGLLPEYPFGLLKSSRLLVSASESESFGIVFCEAMCLGVPIVACRVGGIPEVVRDRATGILVSPDDTGAFAAAMLEIMRDEGTRCRMADEGKRWVLDQFDLRDKVAALFDLFEATVRRRL
jgi:glycosyltransferase involved in cell wall biosynthesis